MILQVSEGLEVGRRIAPKEGAIVTIGRTPNAMEVFSGDPKMSPLHFAIKLRAGGLHVTNLVDGAKTFVNGAQVQSGALKDGDLVTAGVTIFRVIAPAQNPYPAKLRIGGWGLNFIPEGWTVLDGVGLLLETKSGFQPNVVALEDAMPERGTLVDYVKAQIDAAQLHLRNVEFEEVQSTCIDGAEETAMLFGRNGAPTGEFISQRQIYALSGATIGVLTISATLSQAATLSSILDDISTGATFHKPRSAEELAHFEVHELMSKKP